MPSSLITPNGAVRLGVFAEPIEQVNHRDFDLRSPMGRPVGALGRWLGFNQFEFLGGLCDQVGFGVALANVRYAGTAFAYVQERDTGTRTTFSITRPLGLGFSMVQTPESGSSTLSTGTLKVEMQATPTGRVLRAKADGFLIDAEFDETALEPMRICTRAGATGWVYARKTAGHPVRGTLRWRGRTLDLGTAGVLGHHDWSAGYMRRETFWNWGCISGRTVDGRTLGLNASCGVNETSFGESCFWLDGALHRLPGIHFEYDRTDLHKPWHLSDEQGRLSLDFEAEGAHVERIQAGIVASNFTQLLGRYTGTLTTADGETIEVKDQPGYAEWHYAKW